MHDDWLKESHFWYKARMDRVKPLIPQPKVGDMALDVACGTGIMVEYLCTIGYNALGIDIDEDMVQIAERRTKNRWGTIIYRGDAHNLPFASNKFTLVTCLDGLEHCSNDEKVLDEFFRVLSPGGALVMNVPARMEVMGPFDVDVGHYRRYNKKDLTVKLHRARFKIEKMFYWNLAGYAYSLFRRTRNMKTTAKFEKIANLYYKIECFLPVPIGLSLTVKCKKPRAV